MLRMNKTILTMSAVALMTVAPAHAVLSNDRQNVKASAVLSLPVVSYHTVKVQGFRADAPSFA